MKIEGACHPVISVCPFNSLVNIFQTAGNLCYLFFKTYRRHACKHHQFITQHSGGADEICLLCSTEEKSYQIYMCKGEDGLVNVAPVNFDAK